MPVKKRLTRTEPLNQNEYLTRWKFFDEIITDYFRINTSVRWPVTGIIQLILLCSVDVHTQWYRCQKSGSGR